MPQRPRNGTPRDASLGAAGAAKLLLVIAFLGAVVGLGIRYVGVSRKPSSNVNEGTGTAGTQEGQGSAAVPEQDRDNREEDTSTAGQHQGGRDRVDGVADAVEVVPAEEQRAVGLLKRASNCFPEMAFAEAQKLCREASLLRASRETRKTVKELAHKAEQFELAVSHIKVSDFASADTTYELALRGGRSLRGMISDEQAQTVTLVSIPPENPATMGRSRLTIPRVEIGKRRAVSLAERQKEFLGLLERLERSLTLGPGSEADAYYDVVVLSRRLDLRDKCLAYLEAARSKLPDQAVGTFFRGLAIQRAIERATLKAMAGRRIEAEQLLRELTTRMLPDYAPASDAAAAFRADVLSKLRDDAAPTITLKAATGDKTARQLSTAATSRDGAGVEVAAVAGVSSSKPKANSLCESANRLFGEAIAFERKSRAMSGNERHAQLKQAIDRLHECIDRYGEALELDPGNKAIEKRQTDASMFLYALRFKTARMGTR